MIVRNNIEENPGCPKQFLVSSKNESNSFWLDKNFLKLHYTFAFLHFVFTLTNYQLKMKIFFQIFLF